MANESMPDYGVRQPRCDTEPTWKERGIAAACLLVVLLIVFGAVTLIYPVRPLSYDEIRYVEMAQGHVAVEYPYSYRVLVPWLVSSLPLPIFVSFLTVTLISLYVTAFCTYASLRRYRFSPAWSYAGAVLFTASYASTFNLYHFRLVDACGLMWITLSLYFMQSERDLFLAMTLAIGSLCKESVLFVMPIYLLVASRREKPVTLRIAAPVVPALVLFFCAHELHWFGRNTSNYTSRQVHAVFSYQVANYGSVWYALAIGLVASFGAFWLAALLGFRRAPAQLRISGSFLIFVALQLLLGGDWIRMLSIGIPILIPLSMYTLREARSLALLLFAVTDIALCALLYPEHMPLLYFPFHACLVTLSLVLALRRRQTSLS